MIKKSKNKQTKTNPQPKRELREKELNVKNKK